MNNQRAFYDNHRAAAITTVDNISFTVTLTYYLRFISHERGFTSLESAQQFCRDYVSENFAHG